MALAPPAGSNTVLLVEDDAALRGVYQSSLRLAGFSVVAVDDGLTALRAVEREPPAVIVLDLGLPRVSGHDVHRELRAHAETRDIPVVIVTGREILGLDESDVACVLRKPATAEDLIAAITRCLQSRK